MFQNLLLSQLHSIWVQNINLSSLKCGLHQKSLPQVQNIPAWNCSTAHKIPGSKFTEFDPSAPPWLLQWKVSASFSELAFLLHLKASGTKVFWYDIHWKIGSFQWTLEKMQPNFKNSFTKQCRAIAGHSVSFTKVLTLLNPLVRAGSTETAWTAQLTLLLCCFFNLVWAPSHRFCGLVFLLHGFTFWQPRLLFWLEYPDVVIACGVASILSIFLPHRCPCSAKNAVFAMMFMRHQNLNLCYHCRNKYNNNVVKIL